jgi:putative glycerol-1-phosphate prenyltransferase
MGLEVIPTGYMLIDSGAPTTASYISNTIPIPHNKPDIAACTALAGMYLGLKLIYMDGGSGARHMISPAMIAAVRSTIDLPLIIGGGVRSPRDAASLWEAGADIVVVGNALEKDPAGELLLGLGEVKTHLTSAQ